MLDTMYTALMLTDSIQRATTLTALTLTEPTKTAMTYTETTVAEILEATKPNRLLTLAIAR